MRTSSSRPWPLVVPLLALALALAACSSGGTVDGAQPQVTSAPTTSAGPGGEAQEAEPPGDEGGGSGGGSTGGLQVMAAQQVCDTFTASLVGAALGIQIIEAEVSRSSTPQCSYLYGTQAGTPPSDITIASMDSSATGGAADARQGFDFVLSTNRALGAGGEAQEVQVEAGDEAVRLSSSSLHLGIVSVGGKVLTIVVPSDVSAAQVDSLIVAVGQAAG